MTTYHNNTSDHFFPRECTRDIRQEWTQMIDDEDLHYFRASASQPPSSSTFQEHWMNGPPSFSYYTEKELPIDRLATTLVTDYNEYDPSSNIWIPTEGASPSPLITSMISQIIGRQGCFLNQITQEAGIHYMWYNKNPTDSNDVPAYGSFQLWGAPDRLPYAQVMLERQFQYVVSKMNNQLAKQC